MIVARKYTGGNPRNEIKHFLFRRDDDAICELPSEQVRLVDTPVVWPCNGSRATLPAGSLLPCSRQDTANPERVVNRILILSL
jgi:hypothetical protein